MIHDLRDKPLFTPGPLTTSATVKQAMLRDLGSRDYAFVETVAGIRSRLVALAGGGQIEAVPMQGSGTFAVEAALSTTLPRDGKVLVLVNGAYGRRIARMAEVAGIACSILETPENVPPTSAHVDAALRSDSAITHVFAVHCETSTGIMNPVAEIGPVVRAAGRVFMVDAMSSFGAVPIGMDEFAIDFLVSSANKCIEGVPGFAFVLARRAELEKCEGRSRSLSLDLFDQWRGLETNGQFRFTPPTHAILAFGRALDELDAEGGVAGRAARYRANYEIVLRGMREIGFRDYLPEALQGYIITAFRYPEDPKFSFTDFYERLNEKGYVIYPGKTVAADMFRVGNIGRLFPRDMHDLLRAVRETVEELGIRVRSGQTRS